MKKFTYKSLLKAIFSFIIYFILNRLSKNIPFSLSALTAFLNIGLSPVFQPLIFLIANIFSFPLSNCLLLFSGGVFLSIIFFLYKRKNKKPGFELLAWFSVALLPYLFGNFNGDFLHKLLYSAIIYAFAVLLMSAFNIVFIKKFRFKNSIPEQFSLYIVIVVMSLGAINITGVYLWQSIALVVLLFMCHFYKSTKAFIPAFILPIAICLYTKDITTLSIFQIYCVSALIFINISTLLSALSVIVVQFGICFVSGVLPVFGVWDYIMAFMPAVIFLFTPEKIVIYFKKLFTKFEEPEISKEIINVERGEISASLNNLSQSFSDLEDAMYSFDELYLTKEQLIEKISDEIMSSVCSECHMQDECITKNKPAKEDIKKLVSIGVSKGKVTIIDLSRDFSSYCYSTNSMICEVNRLLSVFLEEIEKIEQTKNYKSLVSLQARGICSVLKSLAFDFSSRITFDDEKQKKIFNALASFGIGAKHVVIVGSDVHILFSAEKTDFGKVEKILSEHTKFPMILSTKTNVGSGILAVFKKAPVFDASFGIIQVTKDGSVASGDTHSLTRIDQGRFMLALSDGMGSGEKAYKNSKTAISLLEGFYKAHLDNEKTIEIANKLLSICSKDSFSTLDMASFDLYSGMVSTIKIGATYGFLMGEKGIKIIENNSLPLGILDEVTPSLENIALRDGDMLILCSDGVTDAFFSSSDILDFLSLESTRNPQQLAENIMSFALSLNKGEAKDDMTVIVARIYKK